jgi:uncharacterized membrane-anchored protein
MERRPTVRGLRYIFGIASALLACTAVLAEQEPQRVQLDWARGPATAPIGEFAQMKLGDDYIYLDADGTRKLMELTQNPVSGLEQATVAPASDQTSWFLVFEFDKIGYVPDDEKDSLDADAMLTSIREGTEAANKERRERGWTTMQIVGWEEKPHYDPRTNNLSWAIRGQSEDGAQNINRIVKLLGRRGVMTVTLVASPQELAAAVPAVDALLEGYQFRPGHTYAEYVPGTDELARYGLTALVVGGAGAALVKSGLLAKLWKPIAVALAALGASLKRLLFGGRKVETRMEGPIG